MSIIVGLDAARARLVAYMVEAGALCAIERKGAAGWTTIASEVPLIVESNRASSGRIDPALATANDDNTRTLTLPHGTDLRNGDRLTITAPRGTGILPGQVFTIGTVDGNSMAPALRAVAAIEENAVEQYVVTIERWSDADGAYLPVFSAPAYVMSGRTTVRADQRGAAGVTVLGSIVFEPVPDETLVPEDSVVGIPWATGAFITRINPVVGNRLEANFTYTLGDVT